ncbi:alpha-hydroxy acid oxidase [Robbsia andropogonis]|uniref:alpha-hydroxy acid oxidase n=1 Tax=Robbsia andropogonis TaxID=28092 RepID=UPI00046759E1|nr:alpha-hydroxy acid oxidase [Robbsia andropogonis]MCP1120795.1 alpha-hydroxy-acid oxidizing protein [Robbsia andropogonis]MCP1130588.1 alpha-hydroxy-acid oxidizing protein [Robbsia andropogonis]
MSDLSDSARQALGEHLFGYLCGRATDMPSEATDPNESALARYRLVPRILTGHSTVDIRCTLFGRAYAAPFGVGAFAADRLFGSDGVAAIARVCARLHLPLIVSEEAVTPLPTVKATGVDYWLQIRAAGPLDRAITLSQRALAAGARGVVLTVLAAAHPVPGLYPGGVDVAAEVAARGWSTIGAENGVAHLPAFPGWNIDALETLAAAIHADGGALIVKGVLHADDAASVVAAGADGVMVSNIGVRQSYRWAPSISCLSSVAAALKRTPPTAVLFDGGVRHAADVLVASALGANMSILVRPVVYALATDGEQAVETLLTRRMGEVTALSAWMGVATLSELRPDHLIHVSA